MNIALIKAGGVGSRMNAGIPKQFISVNGKPVIIYTLEAFQNHPSVDEIVVVCLEGWIETLKDYAAKYGITKLKHVFLGGETSLKSIKKGIDAIYELYSKDDVVLIHDANRPLITEEIISDVLAKSEINGMAVATIPCDDEVAVLDDYKDNYAKSFADHKKLYRVQTPDAYKLGFVKDLYNRATEEQLTKLGSTNVLAIQMGYTMYLAEGSSTNIRLTKAEDVKLFEALLKVKE